MLIFLKRTSSPPRPHTQKPTKSTTPFDPSKYSTRLIALKFAYLGRNYNGFEHHANNATPVPTIEEVLWRALTKARLISPNADSKRAVGEVDWTGTEFSKCGRTDKGVSAFGQVIGIRVRSNRPLPEREAEKDLTFGHVSNEEEYNTTNNSEPTSSQQGSASPTKSPSASPSLEGRPDQGAPVFDPITDEIPYAQTLNRILPPEIRILSWCPSPPTGFSARFSCTERRYKYFFTNPAFAPRFEQNRSATAGGPIGGWLDIDKMREAAKLFVGLHDFRNFCKVDPSKQITSFERRIFYSDIEEIDQGHSPAGFVSHPMFNAKNSHQPLDRTSGRTIDHEYEVPKIYSFTLHGSGFLWHQVRCMVAVLFLIGQGLETPLLVSQLLDIVKHPQRPNYEMASDAPLVLWDCVFPEIDGVTGEGDEEHSFGWIPVSRSDPFGSKGGVMEDLWHVWRRHKIDEVLAGTLLDIAANQRITSVRNEECLEKPVAKSRKEKRCSQRVFDGSDAGRLVGRYVPVLERPRLETPEVLNERYRIRKGGGDGQLIN